MSKIMWILNCLKLAPLLKTIWSVVRSFRGIWTDFDPWFIRSWIRIRTARRPTACPTATTTWCRQTPIHLLPCPGSGWILVSWFFQAKRKHEHNRKGIEGDLKAAPNPGTTNLGSPLKYWLGLQLLLPVKGSMDLYFCTFRRKFSLKKSYTAPEF